ncbi:class I SAM-dependent methyltransferase [Micromonospora globispora]|uniref:Class I SAM-dependent methyltransferase n=1 Tax=Micromonospora globispora TaxID=1450148 RepID=A0A317JZ86_9ACTN|nr:class I SAM-dependent methyltransferase [Micromonospora globispora]PWU45728.1 class I SAM-dependent methyltransferase [Micromonospora globispora]PWU58732.1 class I SAM-dependent methyltransferase [Micromonospora globispora]RQW84628.1 class I SAM-dependent methyltransferase [Micromonospora globispora]
MDSRAWDERYASAPELVWTAEPNRFVVEEVSNLSPGRAIDLAAGEGRNAVWLAQQGWEVTAVDFSPVAIERGRELARQRNVTVDWQVADVTEYTPPADGFDLVLIAYLHLPATDIATVLSRARDAVRAGGRVLVVGHDVANLSGGTGGPQNPDILLTPEAVVKGLPGLRIRRAETAPRPVNVDGRTVDALDTVVVAERS